MKKLFILMSILGSGLFPVIASSFLLPRIMLVVVVFVVGPTLPAAPLGAIASSLIAIVGAGGILDPGIPLMPDLLFVL